MQVVSQNETKNLEPPFKSKAFKLLNLWILHRNSCAVHRFRLTLPLYLSL